MNNEHDYTTHAYKWLCYTKHENFYDDVYEFLCPPSDPLLNGVRIRQSAGRPGLNQCVRIERRTKKYVANANANVNRALSNLIGAAL